MWNLIKMMQKNLFTKKEKLKDLETKLMVTKGEILGKKDKLGAWD